MSSDSEYRVREDAVKDPGESLKVLIDLYDLCVLRWQPNEPVSLAEFIRPNVPNGFSYEVTLAGLTGNKEPRWKTTITEQNIDGSATWTCRAAAANGLNVVSGPSAQSDPTGLTISSVSVSENFKILATYAGGVAGESYDAVFTFTLDGLTRIARQRVNVRKR